MPFKGGEALISQMGFKKGRIVEAIVTTYSEDGTPNAAPMGVYGVDEKTLILKVHKNSDTCSNILRTKGCVINMVYDPLLFLRSALAARGEPEIQAEDTDKAETVEAPFLKDSHAYIEAKLLGHRSYRKRDSYGESEVYVLKFSVQKSAVLRACPVGLNRGIAAAIELAIKLSRNEKSGLKEQMRIIRRTLSAAEYKEIASFVDQRL